MHALWHPAYVGIGSNLDGPRSQVLDAFDRLAAVGETRLELRSRLYLSEPLGPQDQPRYVNAVAGLLTLRTPQDLLAELLAIEHAMGRARHDRWGPRIIDLDLLWVPGSPMDVPGLTLPHPGLPERSFVLYPLADIAPTLMIPGHGRVSMLKSRFDGDAPSVLE